MQTLSEVTSRFLANPEEFVEHNRDIMMEAKNDPSLLTYVLALLSSQALSPIMVVHCMALAVAIGVQMEKDR